MQKNQEYYDMTLTELIDELENMQEYNESTLCEVLGHDLYYFSYYHLGEYPLISGEYEEFIGYFLIFLKDGIAFIPFYESRVGNGWEQLDLNGARYLNEEDYETLIESRKRLENKIKIIDQSLEKIKLKLLVNRGIDIDKK